MAAFVALIEDALDFFVWPARGGLVEGDDVCFGWCVFWGHIVGLFSLFRATVRAYTKLNM